MVYIIVKKTQREREAHLAETRSRSSQRNIEGVVRTSEEAFELARQREREGVKFERPYQVDSDSREGKQANEDMMVRQGINPETMQSLHTESTKH